MKYLEFNGYTGSIEYSHEDDILFGKVLGISDLISYEGRTGKELETDFKEAIEEYLEDCKNAGISPQKPYKGSFNVRISPKLHEQAALYAIEKKKSLNSVVAEAIRDKLGKG